MGDEVTGTTPVVEPSAADAIRELRCVIRWGLRHWKAAVLVSVLLAGAVGFLAYRKPVLYISTVSIDVIEDRAFAEGPIPSAHEISKFVLGVPLSDTELSNFMRRMHYKESDLDDMRDLALSEMRDRIALRVTHDARSGGRANTRLALSFTEEDPDLALSLARGLADHVASFQNTQRTVATETERQFASQTEEELRDRLRASEDRLAQLAWQLQNKGVESEEGLQRRFREVEVETDELRSALRRAADRTSRVVLRSTFERDTSGLGYVVVERGRRAPPKRITRTQKAFIFGSAAFVGLVPGLVLAIGGVSFRVYDKDSLRRLGLTCFGHGTVASPRTASLRAREKAARRTNRG